MRPRSNYQHWLDERNGLIMVEDLGGPYMSVTNDAESVVREMFTLYGDKRILYIDSIGNLDELLHDRGRFTGFAPGPGRLL